MSKLADQQNTLELRQKQSFIYLAAGAIGGLIFLPAIIVSIYGLYTYWKSTWALMTSKCPECGAKVGWLQPGSNYKCHSCGEVFIEPPPTEGGKNQGEWFK